jgi:hypothetical protein
LGVNRARQVTDSLRNRTHDDLPDDGVEGLDHLLASVANLAADGISQYRRDYGDQRIFVGDPTFEIFHFRLQIGDLLAVVAE